MPRGLTRPQREGWMLAVVGLEVVVFAAGMGFALRAIKDDCFRLGVLCPLCRKHLLYSPPSSVGWRWNAQHRDLSTLSGPTRR